MSPPHVFISYDHRDLLAAEEIATVLTRVGLYPWLDQWEVPPGERFHAMRYGVLDSPIPILALIGAERSPYVEAEVRAALGTPRGDPPVIPVLLPGADQLPDIFADEVALDLRDTEVNSSAGAAALLRAVLSVLPNRGSGLPAGGNEPTPDELRKALTRVRRILGSDHPDVVQAGALLAESPRVPETGDAATLRLTPSVKDVPSAAERLEVVGSHQLREWGTGTIESSSITTRGIENALRYLGRQTHGIPPEIIEEGLDDPTGSAGIALEPLTRPLRVVAEWTAKERALAIWSLIEDGVKGAGLGPALRSRKRHAVSAGLRLPLEGIPTDAWEASLSSRFKQLKMFDGVFGNPSTTQPMEAAWGSGVKALAVHLGRRLDHLTSFEDWEPYRPHDWPTLDLGEWIIEYDDLARGERLITRRASANAQKVFVELLTVTITMKGRAPRRQVTERLVTSLDPYNDIRQFSVRPYEIADVGGGRVYLPVQSVWGCHAEIVEPSRVGQPPVTQLWFPEPLKYGEQAFFASETIFDGSEEPFDERNWIDVEIDHHGIARGRLLYGQKLPIRGLTIRIRFDDDFPPEAVWWYAEATETERYVRPAPGDRHLLPLAENAVQYTFTEHVCHPREHYGLAFRWP